MTREKVHAREHHHRELIGVLLDEIDNVFRSDCDFAFAWPRENERIVRVESMMCDLRFDRVRVGRKRRVFHQDFEMRFGWAIECRHHQMEVHREAVHADHLQRFRANKPRGRFAQCLVIGVPRRPGCVMRVDAELRPVV